MPISAQDYQEVKTLMEERKGLAEKAIEMTTKVKTENREFTAEEKQTFEGFVNKVNELHEKIETRETLWKAMRVDDKEISKVPAHLRGQYQETGGLGETEKRHVECVLQYMAGDRKAYERPEYRDVQITTPQSGGYLMLPEMMSNRLLKKVDDMMVLSDRITDMTLTDTKTLGVPSIETEMDDLSWTTEIATIPEDSSFAFGKRALVLNPFRKMIKVSDVWLQTITSKSFFSADNQSGKSVTPTSLIENRLAYHIARTKENNFMNGNGINKPLGIFTASTRGISTGRDVDQGASITYNGLVNAKYSLKMQYHKTAAWMFHRLSMGLIMKLVDGNNRPLLNFATLPTQPDSLLGHPVLLSEFVPSVVSNGSYIGMLMDPTFYWAIRSAAIQIKIVDQLYAATGQTAFFALAEADGMPVQEEAAARLKISA